MDTHQEKARFMFRTLRSLFILFIVESAARLLLQQGFAEP
jgi:hypothetical protein